MTEQTYALVNKDSKNYQEYMRWYQEVSALSTQVVNATRDYLDAKRAFVNHRVHQRQYKDWLHPDCAKNDRGDCDHFTNITKAREAVDDLNMQLSHAQGRMQTAADAAISWTQLEARVGKEEAERRGAKEV